jgi:hypothetical protein
MSRVSHLTSLAKLTAKLVLASSLASIWIAVAVASPALAQRAPSWTQGSHQVTCGSEYARYCADSN